MHRHFKVLLPLIVGLGLLQGCGSDNQEELNLDANSTIELNVTVLSEGDEPLSGNSGLKKMILINNADDLATLWVEYTSNDLQIGRAHV